MSVAHHPLYAPRLYRRVRLGILILVLFGSMSFAAVRAMTLDCRNENQRLLLYGGGGCLALQGGGCLLLNGQQQQCELAAGDLRMAVSERAAAILRKLGVPSFYM